MLAAEDQVVQHRAVERSGSGNEPPRRSAIGHARARVSARVIVRENETRAAVSCRVNDDFSKRKPGSILVAPVLGKVKAAGLFVDMGDPKALAGGIGVSQASGEELASGRQAVELNREFGTLVAHAC